MQPIFTDTHCHIFSEYYPNIDNLLDNAQKNNIIKMINNGTDLKSNKEVLEISEKHGQISPAIGFHPEDIDHFDTNNLKIIEKNIDKIIAIGEIGLDYHYENSNREKQKDLFELQLSLAEKYHLPVIVHSRDATEDTINILKKYPTVRGSIHCFSGSLETAQNYIKMGYKLGIGGVLTFKNSNLYKVIEQISLNDIILETDSPYLTPEPYRGKQNEPSNIIFIAKRICEIKNISLEELSKITEKNVREIFDI